MGVPPVAVTSIKTLVAEKSRFQFRAETFNTFNHPSFTGINITVRFDTKGNPASGFGLSTPPVPDVRWNLD
jgi:hypothetical protein